MPPEVYHVLQIIVPLLLSIVINCYADKQNMQITNDDDNSNFINFFFSSTLIALTSCLDPLNGAAFRT